MAEWTLDTAAHLLRRAAFGGSPAAARAFHARHGSVASAVDELLAFPESRRRPPGPRDVDDYQRLKMQRWWLKEMIRARTPADACREKLVLFLHGHLASGASKQPTLKHMAVQNQLFRRFARGSYRTLLRHFARDAANLYYLDGILNVASHDGVHVHANENFGRELLELFTLGVFQLAEDGSPDPAKPNYTERDVHNLARACTGWTALSRGRGVWREDDWDGGRYDDDGDDRPDPMVLFGRVSNGLRIDERVAGTPDDVLELIFARTDDGGRSQVAMHLAGRLWAWYAYPPPAPGLRTLLAGFADAFAAADFELTPLLRAMWTHDEFYGERARTRTVKNPCDYAVGALRALEVTRGDGRRIGGAARELGEQLALMGLDLFEPPNVAGWPGGTAWINSGTLLARLELARDLAAADFGRNAVSLARIEGMPMGNPAADPAAVVGAILAQLGLDAGPLALGPAQRAALLAYATADGPTLDLSHEYTHDATTRVRGLLALALQTAEYQVF